VLSVTDNYGVTGTLAHYTVTVSSGKLSER